MRLSCRAGKRYTLRGTLNSIGRKCQHQRACFNILRSTNLIREAPNWVFGIEEGTRCIFQESAAALDRLLRFFVLFSPLRNRLRTPSSVQERVSCHFRSRAYEAQAQSRQSCTVQLSKASTNDSKFSPRGQGSGSELSRNSRAPHDALSFSFFRVHFWLQEYSERNESKKKLRLSG